MMSMWELRAARRAKRPLDRRGGHEIVERIRETDKLTPVIPASA